MTRVEVVCEIEKDGSVKVEVEASDRAVCAAEAAALRERLSGKMHPARTVATNGVGNTERLEERVRKGKG